MTKEQQRREQFLRSRGSLSRAGTRELFLQRHEIRCRVDWLKDHVRRFADATSPTAVALRKEWFRELHEKQTLLLNLAEGRSVSRAEIAKTTNPFS